MPLWEGAGRGCASIVDRLTLDKNLPSFLCHAHYRVKATFLVCICDEILVDLQIT